MCLALLPLCFPSKPLGCDRAATWVTSAAEKKESSEAELSSSSVRSRRDPSASGSIKVFSGGQKEATCVGIHGPTFLLAPVLPSTPTLSLLLCLAYRKDIKPGRKLAFHCSQEPYPDPAARCPTGERSQTLPGGGRLGARGTPASQQTPSSGTPPGTHINVTLSWPAGHRQIGQHKYGRKFSVKMGFAVCRLND